MSGDMDYIDMTETHNNVTTKKKKKWWIALIVVGVLLIFVFPEFCGSGSVGEKTIVKAAQDVIRSNGYYSLYDISFPGYYSIEKDSYGRLLVTLQVEFVADGSKGLFCVILQSVSSNGKYTIKNSPSTACGLKNNLYTLKQWNDWNQPK